MPRRSSRSSEPYIEEMPRRHRRSGHSHRGHGHGYGDRTSLDLAMVPYAERQVPPYGPDYSESWDYYPASVSAGHSRRGNPGPPGIEEESWGSKKDRLEDRFQLHRPHPTDTVMPSFPHYGPIPAMIPYPDLKPRPAPMMAIEPNGGRQQPPTPTMETVPYTSRKSPPDMLSFARWIKDHSETYHPIGKVTDIARRLHHNMSDFTLRLQQCRRPAPMYHSSRKQQKEHEARLDHLCQLGDRVQTCYMANVDRYAGPWIPIRCCSSADKADAQRLLDDMFNRDYDEWDGLMWHLINWINNWSGKRAPLG
ncbi:hypothetical protein F5X98DRAFT_230262 [Xylaria grammica]|nr:hypothetical protein F5X98DRAFT_230262 [Xylaria grammica]